MWILGKKSQPEDFPKHIYAQECLLKEGKYKRKNIAKEKKIHLTQTIAIFLSDKSRARWLEKKRLVFICWKISADSFSLHCSKLTCEAL